MKNIINYSVILSLILMISISSCRKKEVPVVETDPISNITGTSAACGGNIIDDRGETVLTRGVCWSKNIEPSISDSKTTDGAGAGSFSSSITDLLPATDYYIRAYATSSSGTGYGMVMAFKTKGAVPLVMSPVVSGIGINTATISGLINPNYISTIVTVDYGTTINYGFSAITVPGPVTGSIMQYVSTTISGLNAATTYHYRIKAENSSGVTYGASGTFKTLGGVPVASTVSPSNLLATSATLRGFVNANYILTTVTFEYGTTTSYGSSIGSIPVNVNGTSMVSVSANLNGLTEGTTYHYRVKAENSIGVTYGNDISFVPLTPSNFVLDIEGNSYSIVTIGTQKWMGENLKTTKYNDNTNIPNVTDATAWISLSTPAYCWYNNDIGYKATYGAIYNYYTVSTGKLCPEGWHVPSNTEFTTLTDYLGGINVAGGKLKETGTTKWASPNAGATNETGFGAVPGGQRDEAGVFIGFSMNSIFWSSTAYNIYKPWYRSLSYVAGSVFEGNGSLNIRGFSVRCIKD